MDRTAQTEPLTTGQSIVAKWEGPASPWSEPADLAEAIDKAIAAETASLRAELQKMKDKEAALFAMIRDPDSN